MVQTSFKLRCEDAHPNEISPKPLLISHADDSRPHAKNTRETQLTSTPRRQSPLVPSPITPSPSSVPNKPRTTTANHHQIGQHHALPTTHPNKHHPPDPKRHAYICTQYYIVCRTRPPEPKHPHARRVFGPRRPRPHHPVPKGDLTPPTTVHLLYYVGQTLFLKALRTRDSVKCKINKHNKPSVHRFNPRPTVEMLCR